MKNLLQKIDKYLDKHTTLWIFIIILVILRIPNFFEPYWYGDEGIYLTIGQSIGRGQKLYTDIVDHKTPIIYYLASVPNQFYFRVLLVFWMIATTAVFYVLSRIFFKKDYLVWLSMAIFVIFTTLPWLEGNIPNGELFVMGFVVVGWWLAIKSGFLQSLFNSSRKKTSVQTSQKLLLLSGIFYGLAILTKVPAMTDFAAILLVPWFLFVGKILPLSQQSAKKILRQAGKILQKWWAFFAGALLMVLLSILYFVTKGSGADYLQFGLLYNFHYTQSWSPNLGNQLLNWLFTLPAKTLLLAMIIIFISYLKSLSLKFKFFLGWSFVALYSALLSNRPYPHYMIQVILPISFLITLTVGKFRDWIATKRDTVGAFTGLLATMIFLAITTASLLLLNFGSYSTSRYYKNFFRFIRGDLNQQEYYQTFNHLMNDNYQVSNFLQKLQEKELFIWGTNPMLYALSQTVPVSRFTVSFHITDLKAYDETLEQVSSAKPRFIVVMNNAPSFPEFYTFLDEHYLANYEYDHMMLYKRLNAETEADTGI